MNSDSSSRLLASPWRRELVVLYAVPLHAVFAYGIAESILMSLFPVVMVDRGHTVAQMSLAFSVFVLGGLVSTVPVTRLADRYGQERALAGCAAVGAVGSLVMTWSGAVSVTLIASALTGAALGPVFALALAIVGRRLPAEQLPAGSAIFTVAFSVGSMVAPFLAAVIMRKWGGDHLFTLSSALFASLLIRIVVVGAPLEAEQIGSHRGSAGP